MGNTESSHAGDEEPGDLASFPGSALLEKIPCGNINDTHQEGMFGMATRGNLPTPNGSAKSTLQKFFNQAEALCVQSPNSAAETGTARSEFFDDEYEDFAYNKKKDESSSSKKENTPSSSNTPSSLQSEQQQQGGDRQSPAANSSSNNPTSALFARALVNEVTDNPKTMKPAEMAEREKRLLKAQQQAKKMAANQKDGPKPVGAPGGIGKPSVLGSIAHALTGSADGLGNVSGSVENKNGASVLPPNSLSENRAQVGSSSDNNSITVDAPPGKHTITIGLSLSRRHSIGHPDTVTRQTAFDFNELQDREYKYVSSTDSSGWRAGGGERGGPHGFALGEDPTMMDSEEGAQLGTTVPKSTGSGQPPARPSKESQPGTPAGVNYKVAAPDTVHIPIIHIDAESPQAVDMIIAALARGEIFIPHMAILPEALSVNGISPPDLVVRFGTERNDDLPPDEWPNWCLEFMHNQLYEYFQSMGARWMKRPFSITLARKVRWKTVKHMNRYFAHAERVIDAWREKGPQYLDPQLSYIEGGATPEEVSRPHGIYLLRNGVATNYFAPNFDPPYTTKMTRSLLLNVLGKSWNPKRREWTSEPVPKLVTPSLLMATMCGCSDNTAGGFMANEVTMSASDKLGEGRNTSIPAAARSTSTSMDAEDDSAQEPSSKKSATRQPKREPPPQQQRPHDETDADQEDNAARTSTASSSALGSDAAVAEMLSKRGEGSSSAAGSTQRRGVDPDNDEKSESAAKPLGPRSPRAMRAPTPERMDPVGASSRGGAVASNKSDVFQPSVTGTNSTIMHMNLSTENFMKRDMERRQAREEKKEDPDPTASNDGLPDLMVSLHQDNIRLKLSQMCQLYCVTHICFDQLLTGPTKDRSTCIGNSATIELQRTHIYLGRGTCQAGCVSCIGTTTDEQSEERGIDSECATY